MHNHVLSLSELLLRVTKYTCGIEQISNSAEPTQQQFDCLEKSLALTNEDRRQLLSGGWLTASHISAVHHLLKQAYPKQNELCDTNYLADKYMWPCFW